MFAEGARGGGLGEPPPTYLQFFEIFRGCGFPYLPMSLPVQYRFFGSGSAVRVSGNRQGVPMENEELTILLIEDNPGDALLIKTALADVPNV